MARLIFKKNNQEIFSYNIKNASINLGRGVDCHVVLPDPEISREQASIYKLEDLYYVKKIGKAAQYINGEQKDFSSLKPGDKVQIGPWTIELMAYEEQADPVAETIVQSLSAPQGEMLGSISRQQVLISVPLLSLFKHEKLTHKFKLEKNIQILGASAKADCIVEDDEIAPLQYKMLLSGEDLQILDVNGLASLNINGEFKREVQLKKGESVTFQNYHLVYDDVNEFSPVYAPQVDHFFGLVGKSQAMRNLYGMIARVARSEAPVLILGESGSGKELIACAVHLASQQNKKPFVALNCGAISKELVESELFGHEKGSFTGAQTQRSGAFEYVKDGTLFLDEIGELSAELQPKLLRVLENKTFKRVGGNQDLPSFCRIVAATHRDLASMVREKKFREDLFFRLFVLPIYIPSLRERIEDLPLLVDHFLKEFGGSEKTLSTEAMKKLMEHPWPGNVRELKNVLQRAYVLSQGKVIDAADLFFAESMQNQNSEKPVLSAFNIESMEKQLIIQSLDRNRGNKKKTAQSLGIARSTLFKKLKYYDISTESQF